MTPEPKCAAATRFVLDVLAAGIRSAPTTAPAPQADIDWRAVASFARCHRIQPLLWQSLRTCASVAESVRDEIRRSAYVTTARNLFLLAELARILDLLSSANIPALPVKGPVMAAQLYGDPGLRPCEDLDLLVPESGIAGAVNVLTANGFCRMQTFEPWQEARQIHGGWGQGLRKADGSFSVEVSPWIVPRHFAPAEDAAAFMARGGRIDIGGRSFPTLRPTDMLVILALHGAKHGWSRLQWVADIAALVKRFPDLEWSEVAHVARRCGSVRSVGVALRISRRLLGSGMPETYRLPPDDKTADALAETFVRRLITFETAPRGPGTELAMNLRLADSWVLRLRHLILLGLTPSYGDWCSLRLPEGLRWLYWLLRPLRLAGSLPRKLKRPLKG
jgi:hypothetical protein